MQPRYGFLPRLRRRVGSRKVGIPIPAKRIGKNLLKVKRKGIFMVFSGYFQGILRVCSGGFQGVLPILFGLLQSEENTILADKALSIAS